MHIFEDFFHGVEHSLMQLQISIHTASRSGVSRCLLCYIYKPFYRQSSG